MKQQRWCATKPMGMVGAGARPWTAYAIAGFDVNPFAGHSLHTNPSTGRPMGRGGTG